MNVKSRPQQYQCESSFLTIVANHNTCLRQIKQYVSRAGPRYENRRRQRQPERKTIKNLIFLPSNI